LWAGVDSAWEQKNSKPEKCLTAKHAAESHLSAGAGVSRLFLYFVSTHCL